MKNILITGVTGTMGQALLNYLARDKENNILGISRDEQKQRHLLQAENVKYKICDVRDLDGLSRITNQKIDIIYHLAALKCVDTIEDNPVEAIKTNIVGTQNIFDIAGEAKIVFTSTDKACYPINAYGQSKALAEKIVLQNPKNVVCRYGNVLGSRGSILSPLIKSLKEESKAYLTHKKMSRFWMPQQEVRDFILACGDSEVASGLMVPVDIKSSYVSDLIHSVAKILRIYQYEIIETGVRPGEKFNEILLTEYETPRKKDISTSDNHRLMTAQELKKMLKPIVEGMI
ncbi:MAG: polysaccharide biosynthesis protein [Promethearchaeota archaeon]|jgi:FlaA1/EpsC-like NDP-sugar epimerase